MTRLALVALFVPVLAHAQPAKPKPVPTAAQVLAGVEATYKSTTELTATFDESVTNPIYGTTAKSTGELFAAKPDKMRWDYKKRDKLFKWILYDGTTLWIVEPSKLEVTKIPASASSVPAQLAFFTGNGTLAQTFGVAFASGSTTTLELTPKQPSAAYAKLVLDVDPSTAQVAKTTVTNSSGVTTTIAFTNVKLVSDKKPTIQPSVFRFDPKSCPNCKITVISAPAAPPTKTPAKPAATKP